MHQTCTRVIIIMRQCIQNIANHLKAFQDYEQMEERADVLILIKLPKKIALNFEEQKNVVDALLLADKNSISITKGISYQMTLSGDRSHSSPTRNL